MGGVAYEVVSSLQDLLGIATKMAQLIAVGSAVAAGVLVYFLLATLLRLEEFQLVVNLAKRRLGLHRRSGALQ